MTDIALAETLEKRLFNAWPALETLVHDRWLLRFARGYSKRANAASPVTLGANLDASDITQIAALYRAQNIAPCFRLTPLSAPDAEAALEAAGLVPYDPSLALAAPLSDLALTPDPRIAITPAATARWVTAAAASYGGDKSDHQALGEIVARIRPAAAFATLVADGKDMAWGLAVAERGYVGLFDIVVAPAARGAGLGRAIVTTLMGWGRDQGAHTAYMQVRETNEVAISLYRSLGFAEAYRYSHRVYQPSRG